MVPAPSMIANVTAAPATGAPFCTSLTDGAAPTAVFTTALCESTETRVIVGGAAAVAVAVNVAGDPAMPVATAVASSVLAPSDGPSVQLPIVATPDASVTGDAPVTDPPPPVTVKFTVTFATPLLNASTTRTAGRVAT